MASACFVECGELIKIIRENAAVLYPQRMLHVITSSDGNFRRASIIDGGALSHSRRHSGGPLFMPGRTGVLLEVKAQIREGIPISAEQRTKNVLVALLNQTEAELGKLLP